MEEEGPAEVPFMPALSDTPGGVFGHIYTELA